MLLAALRVQQLLRIEVRSDRGTHDTTMRRLLLQRPLLRLRRWLADIEMTPTVVGVISQMRPATRR